MPSLSKLNRPDPDSADTAPSLVRSHRASCCKLLSCKYELCDSVEIKPRNDHHDSSQFSPSPSRTTHTAPASRRRGSLRSNLRATRIRNCSLDTSDSAGLMVQTRSASSSPAKGVSVNGAEGQEMTRCQAHEAAERAAAPEVRVIVARCGESPLQAPPAGRPRRSRCCSGAPPTWRPF